MPAILARGLCDAAPLLERPSCYDLKTMGSARETRRAGQIGLFVTLLAGCAGHPSHTVHPEALRLCSWNIKKLGHGQAKDYDAVAAVLESSCDASVVLEIMQKQGEAPGYTQLLDALGAGWTGLITSAPRPNTTSANSEFYAIVWRVEHLEQCSGWNGLRFVRDHDGSRVGVGDDYFAREPAFGCFVARGQKGEVDFLLAAYHATWSGGDVATIQAEASELERVFEEMAAARPGEEDLLLIGDINLTPLHLSAATSLLDFTVGEGSTLNSAGQVTSNLYDHLLLRSLTFTPELRAPAEVLDVRDVVQDGATFYRSVSDHLPLRVIVTFDGPDDD